MVYKVRVFFEIETFFLKKHKQKDLLSTFRVQEASKNVTSGGNFNLNMRHDRLSPCGKTSDICSLQSHFP